MSFPYFRGVGSERRTDAHLPQSKRPGFTSPEHYITDSRLADAVNVALTLGQPLLLSGEPGTGKSALAYRIAWELGLGKVLKFETKSDSTSSSLFYTSDTLRRFQDAQTGVRKDALEYITFNALGLAILRSQPAEKVKTYFEKHPGEPSRSLVLIDEVDKAPRDFPNDILNEIDQQYFRIPEIDNEPIEANPAFSPIVIITSNSEKDLPPAFLRRCVYYNIEFPDPAEMKAILEARLAGSINGYSGFLQQSLDLFFELRAHQLEKKPATSELLEWIVSMRTIEPDAQALTEDLSLKTSSCLSKTAADQSAIESLIRKWHKPKP